MLGISRILWAAPLAAPSSPTSAHQLPANPLTNSQDQSHIQRSPYTASGFDKSVLCIRAFGESESFLYLAGERLGIIWHGCSGRVPLWPPRCFTAAAVPAMTVLVNHIESVNWYCSKVPGAWLRCSPLNWARSLWIPEALFRLAQKVPLFLSYTQTQAAAVRQASLEGHSSTLSKLSPLIAELAGYWLQKVPLFLTSIELKYNYWGTVALQYCVGLWHISIQSWYTYVPSLLNLPPPISCPSPS